MRVEAGTTHPAPWQRPSGHGISVLVVTASIGAGHDRPAHEMAARIRGRGGRVTVVDLVDLAPLGSALRTAFRSVLTHRPQLWGRLHASSDGPQGLPAGVTTAIDAVGRRLARTADDREVDLVISTFPLGGRVVGAAHRHSSRPLPLATCLTDPAVHALWVDGFADLYLTSWVFAVPLLTDRTEVPVVACAPAVGAGFVTPLGIRATRPQSPCPRALISSGSWGSATYCRPCAMCCGTPDSSRSSPVGTTPVFGGRSARSRVRSRWTGWTTWRR